jgi:hypothetical protein
MRIFPFLLIPVTVFLAAASAHAQEASVESDVTFDEAGPHPLVYTYMQTMTEAHRWGVGVTAIMTDTLGEAYAGPTFKPSQALSLNVAMGFAIDGLAMEALDRYGASATFNGERWQAGLWLEADRRVLDGNDAAWGYILCGTRTITPIWRVGVTSRHDLGIGPMTIVQLPKTQLSLWGTWTPYRWETAKAATGNGAFGLILTL